jgi:hypothetical protein
MHPCHTPFRNSASFAPEPSPLNGLNHTLHPGQRLEIRGANSWRRPPDGGRHHGAQALDARVQQGGSIIERDRIELGVTEPDATG